jgi:peroxiredoxin/predicted 2-oxoglutarate/Fe(II)-dependent dioxygenase YbiX
MPLATAAQLECGDRIASFILPDQDGDPATPVADEVAGKPALLVFECGTGDDDGASYANELMAMRDHTKAIMDNGATVFAITRRGVAENKRLHAEHDLPFQILSDSDGTVFKACGLEPVPPGCPTVTLVVDPNFRAVRAIGGGAAGSHAPRALAELVQLEKEYRRTQIGTHPPVLVLPRALTPEDCARLIEVWRQPATVWETDGMHCEGYAVEKGDFKVRNESYGRVLQLVVRNPQVQQYLDTKLRRRILPEISKAFQTTVAKREDYRIAGYDAAEGGSLPAHRDNPTPETQQRRFTMSVTLNAEEYTGGALRFPEYGGHEYLVPTGAAVVWSCSLLHEVLPVTAGQRFILGTHLFGT